MSAAVYRAVIVDDDVETVRGLSGFIDWEAHGFTVVGTALSAEEALPVIRESRPDLLITDITMTGADGFSLLEESRRHVPALEAIILTCHADFDFAQTAIESGVIAYLTKVTLAEDELARALEKTRRSIQQRGDTVSRIVDRQKKLAGLLRDDTGLFADVVDDGDGAGAPLVSVRLGLLRLRDRSLYPPDNWTELDNQLFVAEHVRAQLPGRRVEGCVLDASTTAVVEWLSERGAGRDSFSEALQRLADLLERRFGAPASVMLSADQDLHSSPAATCDELVALQDAHFYEAKPPVLVQGRSVPTGPRVTELLDWTELRTALVRARDKQDVSEHLSAVRLHRCDPASVRELEQQLIDYLSREAERLGVTLGRHPPADTFDGFVRRLGRSVVALRDAYAQSGEISARSEINRVARYVREHLASPISAEAMAELAGMSLAHFSRVFKAESGLTFSEYLTHKRVDAAKTRLRETNDVIEEVARATGFENAAYFYRVFKRAVGVTPGDYRAR
jgi:two-component system response regulator YesN